MAETTASASTSVTKEGVQIKGKDVILLNAPEVLLSPDTPLLTTAQDVAGAINELFMLDPGGGDDWSPPDDWLDVPEPEPYEINLLAEITDLTSDNYRTMELIVSRPSDYNTGYGPIKVDWGDGTIDEYDGRSDDDTQAPWDKLKHLYTATGQYVIKVVTTDQSCFLQSINPFMYYGDIPGNQLLIAKLGSKIILNNDSFTGGTSATQAPFADRRRLHWVKINGDCVLPRSRAFQNCFALRRLDLAVPLTDIPVQTFYACKNLNFSSIDFSRVTSIGKMALSNAGVKKISLPECESIGEQAFYQCFDLREISAPKCTTVGASALSGCYGLNKSEFDDGCTFGSSAFEYCYSLYPRPDGSIN